MAQPLSEDGVVLDAWVTPAEPAASSLGAQTEGLLVEEAVQPCLLIATTDNRPAPRVAASARGVAIWSAEPALERSTGREPDRADEEGDGVSNVAY
jgi:hypothetical protein